MSSLFSNMAFANNPFILRFPPCTSAKRPRRPARMEIVRRVTKVPTGPSDAPKSIRIAFTREEGKNKKLMDGVERILPYAEFIEFNCVETVEAEDTKVLPERLKEGMFKWVVITSPEAANVFIRAWRKVDFPKLPSVAAVGRATGDALRAVGIEVEFEPTKATGKTLAKEFPEGKEGEQVLYPASRKASGVVEEGLQKKGYTVVRLNTYSTETALGSDLDKDLANGAHIATFASPSAVRGWVENLGVNDELTIACIGETSAAAARKAGFKNVHYPEKPGTEGWIEAICHALGVHRNSDLAGVVTHDFTK